MDSYKNSVVNFATISYDKNMKFQWGTVNKPDAVKFQIHHIFLILDTYF